LEFLLADALKQKADTLITCGAAQSNHARQTAAAAAKFGLNSVLVLRGEKPAESQGNLLIDQLVGAAVVWAGDRPLEARMREAARDLRADGHRPYVIPYGGSNPIGASGYVLAMEELVLQCEEQGVAFDHIVFASSSGGTQAGLALGAEALGFTGRILGISVEPEADTLCNALSDLATATADYLGLNCTLAADDFAVNDDYLGGGYGVVGELEREAVATLGRAEGLLLDPVYTGRAFGGLLDMIRVGAFRQDERLLFWHTGGTGGLFGYAHRL
jgi:D-cysteine desulfhydrase